MLDVKLAFFNSVYIKYVEFMGLYKLIKYYLVLEYFFQIVVLFCPGH